MHGSHDRADMHTHKCVTTVYDCTATDASVRTRVYAARSEQALTCDACQQADKFQDRRHTRQNLMNEAHKSTQLYPTGTEAASCLYRLGSCFFARTSAEQQLGHAR
eukprot:5349064-Pleurochrysis_carterae.AAC.1